MVERRSQCCFSAARRARAARICYRRRAARRSRRAAARSTFRFPKSPRSHRQCSKTLISLRWYASTMSNVSPAKPIGKRRCSRFASACVLPAGCCWSPVRARRASLGCNCPISRRVWAGGRCTRSRRLATTKDWKPFGCARATAGWKCRRKVARYILARYPRDLDSLFALLDKLDVASLAEQRRLTIPFLRSLEERGS